MKQKLFNNNNNDNNNNINNNKYIISNTNSNTNTNTNTNKQARKSFSKINTNKLKSFTKEFSAKKIKNPIATADREKEKDNITLYLKNAKKINTNSKNKINNNNMTYQNQIPSNSINNNNNTFIDKENSYSKIFTKEKKNTKNSENKEIEKSIIVNNNLEHREKNLIKKIKKNILEKNYE